MLYRSACMKSLMFWKDLSEPGRPGRIAYLIDVFCLIVSFGFFVGLVLMWAVRVELSRADHALGHIRPALAT